MLNLIRMVGFCKFLITLSKRILTSPYRALQNSVKVAHLSIFIVFKKIAKTITCKIAVKFAYKVIVVCVADLIVQNMAFVQSSLKSCFCPIIRNINNQRDISASLDINFKLRTKIVDNPRVWALKRD